MAIPSRYKDNERICRVHAGVFADKMVTTGDGFELTWQVNVLAPYILGALLAKAVKERIINVSSISAGSRIDFNNLNQVCSNNLLRGITSPTKNVSRRTSFSVQWVHSIERY